MSSKLATPRTDELLKKHADFKMSAWDSLMEYRNLCFQMERELAEARQEIGHWRNTLLRNSPEEVLHNLNGIYEQLKQAEQRLAEAEKIICYVSRGRGYVGMEPYPDASARAWMGANVEPGYYDVALAQSEKEKK